MLSFLHDEDPSIAFVADIYALGSTFFELLTGSCLGVLDQSFRADLLQSMGAIRRGHRRRIYDQLISGIAESHPLPGVEAFGAQVPASVLDRVNHLYKSMAALNYRARLSDFNRMFLGIQTCLIILRNDEKYRRWRERKHKYREALEERRKRALPQVAVRR
jgi:hypothetical protein